MHKIQLKYINYDGNSSKKDIHNKEHSVAYSILKVMLKEHFGIENPVFLKTENGKPYIDCEGVHFSIAHTHGLVCVLVGDSPLGVDCELMRERGECEIKRFAKRFFTENELKLLSRENYSQRAFYKIWTSKEATIKKIGGNMSYVKKIDTTMENVEFLEENNYIVCINI